LDQWQKRKKIADFHSICGIKMFFSFRIRNRIWEKAVENFSNFFLFRFDFETATTDDVNSCHLTNLSLKKEERDEKTRNNVNKEINSSNILIRSSFSSSSFFVTLLIELFFGETVFFSLSFLLNDNNKTSQ
jgi:hypothetical protein